MGLFFFSCCVLLASKLVTNTSKSCLFLFFCWSYVSFESLCLRLNTEMNLICSFLSIVATENILPKMSVSFYAVSTFLQIAPLNTFLLDCVSYWTGFRQEQMEHHYDLVLPSPTSWAQVHIWIGSGTSHQKAHKSMHYRQTFTQNK